MSVQVSFDELIRRWASQCSACRLPCAADDAKQLELGHAMHQVCYEWWLLRHDERASRVARQQARMAAEEFQRRALEARADLP